MGVKIVGVGSYLPKKIVTKQEWIQQRAGKDNYGKIHDDYYDVPNTVHHAGPEDSSSLMGANACIQALSNANLKPEDIDLLLCFSVIPDHIYPKDGQNIVNIAKLPNAVALDIDLACGSFQSLLKVGASFINQGLHRRVALVCTANWVNRAIDKTQDHSPLGDGAAAVILEESPVNSFVGVMEKREESFFEFVRLNCPAQTGLKETIQFKFTDEFKNFLKTRATDVAKELMVKTGNLPQDIDWIICHQVGQKALRGWCRTLEIAEEKLLSTYMHTGNCMASNMPLVLDHFINKNPCIKRGDMILFYSLSMGYHASALLWRY